MKRQEEIKEVAGTYAIDEVKDTCNPASKRGLLYAGFIDGAEWADQHPHWISVEERKPKLKHKNDYYQYSDVVIVTDGEYRTSACWVHSTLSGWYAWLNGGEKELIGVTHWMPLPEAPKKGGENENT